MTSRPDFEDTAFQIFNAFAGTLNRGSSGYSMMMQAVDFAFGPSYEVLVFGDESNPDTQNMIKSIRNIYQPNKVVLFGGMKNKNIAK